MACFALSRRPRFPHCLTEECKISLSGLAPFPVPGSRFPHCLTEECKRERFPGGPSQIVSHCRAVSKKAVSEAGASPKCALVRLRSGAPPPSSSVRGSAARRCCSWRASSGRKRAASATPGSSRTRYVSWISAGSRPNVVLPGGTSFSAGFGELMTKK